MANRLPQGDNTDQPTETMPVWTAPQPGSYERRGADTKHTHDGGREDFHHDGHLPHYHDPDSGILVFFDPAAEAPNSAASEVDPIPAVPAGPGAATPDAARASEPVLTGGSGGAAGSGRPCPAEQRVHGRTYVCDRTSPHDPNPAEDGHEFRELRPIPSRRPRTPRAPWNRRRRDLPADPVTGQIETDALWNARMRVEFVVDLDDELAAFEREMEQIKAVAMDAGVTYADLHRRITFAQEASRLGFTGLAQVQAYVFVGDRLDADGGAA